MVISAYPKTYRSICMVCDLCVGNRIKIQIDHVVKRPDNRTHNFTDICRIIYRKVTK